MKILQKGIIRVNLMNKKHVLLSVFLVFFTLFCQAQNWDINLLKDINVGRNHSLDQLFKMIIDYAPPIAYTIPFFLLGL